VQAKRKRVVEGSPGTDASSRQRAAQEGASASDAMSGADIGTL
jgi:hypothetical protein